ncbi:MAG: trypsin-like peptidase domain-containing protein, partial [Planctomycetales bacterium]|nr:trypsin-like peptidase domain-containing protein [Planctomycetales bacterium]
RWWFKFGFDSGPRTITPRGALADFEQTTVDLFDAASPSVVFVTTSSRVINPYSRRTAEVESGSGSGFVWDNAGHIVTNFHVIQHASSAKVVMFDQTSYDASLVGYSDDHDLAVLKIRAPAAQIRPIAIGESSTLAVGQSIFAIGNPFGLNHTLTTGVVSAKSRTIEGPAGRPIEEVIQIDAAINPGNSGGPLLDSAGRLVGVNTAIYSPSGASAGVGFAVPIDTVNRVVPQIIKNRRYEPPQLGVLINSDFSDRVTRQLNIPGVLVFNVKPNSGAASAGMQGTRIGESQGAILGDIIQEVGGREIKSMNDLQYALDRFSPGDTVSVKVWRANKQIELQVELD